MTFIPGAGNLEPKASSCQERCGCTAFHESNTSTFFLNLNVFVIVCAGLRALLLQVLMTGLETLDGVPAASGRIRR